MDEFAMKGRLCHVTAMARNEPSSDFLKAVIAQQVPFEGQIGSQNLAHLVRLTSDADRTNRDWATFLLAQTEFDTPDIRQALRVAASDEDYDVRCEALLGMAQRNVPEASALIQQVLCEESVGTLIVEAAGLVSDANLVPRLVELRDWWDVDRELLEAAISACETGVKLDK
jgi:HEAT repeat protein